MTNKTTKKKSFLPTPIEVVVNGETVSILPFPFGKLHIVATKLAPLFDAYKGLQAGASVDVAELFEAGGENLQELLAMAAGKPREWMDTVYDYDEGRALLVAVFEANNETILKKIVRDLAVAMPSVIPAVAV